MDNRPLPFLAVPIYGSIPAQFHICMMEAVKQRAVFSQELCRSEYCGDSLVTRARNELTRQFLESNCTDLIFIDSDLMFSAEQLKRLLSHDVDIVGGCYPIKDQSKLPRWVLNTHFHPRQPDERGLIDVRYVGTGFMRIRRRVFERMIESGVAPAFTPDHRAGATEYDFWPVGVYNYSENSAAVVPEAIGTSRYLSEDWFFCQNALDLGFNVWADAQVILRHVGQAVYPLDSQLENLGTSEQDIFRSAETGGADSAATSPVAAASPATLGV